MCRLWRQKGSFRFAISPTRSERAAAAVPYCYEGYTVFKAEKL